MNDMFFNCTFYNLNFTAIITLNSYDIDITMDYMFSNCLFYNLEFTSNIITESNDFNININYMFFECLFYDSNFILRSFRYIENCFFPNDRFL